MSKTLNIIPENPFIVLIGLNPTEEAIANKAVFSRDNAFWNILTKAGLIKEESVSGVKLNDVPLKERAIEVFEKQNFKLNGYTAGFADLLPLTSEKFSKKVTVPLGSAIHLFKTTPNLQNAKKIILMGQMVVDGFAQDFKSLKKWSEMPRNSNGSKSYGHIGNIAVNENVIHVYAMPFPVNNNIKNKHIIYNSVLNDKNAIQMNFIVLQKGKCEECDAVFGVFDSVQSTNVICSKCKKSSIVCKTCKDKGCECSGKLLDSWDVNEAILS